MLAHDRTGAGRPLLLLHGTNSSRAVWSPLLADLAAARDVIAVDLPAHGDSPPTSMTPPAWAPEVAALLDALGVERPAVVGHSAGGWTALELAKLGRASSVLALAPAGLWARRSPIVTDLGLQLNWRLGRLTGPLAPRFLATAAGRRAGLRMLSARPGEVPADVAVASARTAASSRHFPEHFRRTRVLRLLGGDAIGPDVPAKVVWGDRDRVARQRTSRHTDQLPAHAVVETWERCGHMVMWDRRDDVVREALALP